MRRAQRDARLVILGLVSLAMAACDNALPPTESGTGDVRAEEVFNSGSEASETFHSIDDLFASIAEREIPGFGGYWVDEQGVLNLHLKDPSRQEQAITALSRILDRFDFGRQIGPDIAQRRVVHATYDYTELYRWRNEARHLIGTPGLIRLGIDEVRNRVFIGIEDPAVRSLVETGLKRLGIPAQAVLIEVVAPAVPLQTEIVEDPNKETSGGSTTPTLSSRYRPLIGGLEIFYERNDSSFPCTFGVNTKNTKNTNENVRFLTNSHCTAIRGGPENTPYAQGGSFIGTEIADPVYTTNASTLTGHACPSGFVCRNSDAALVSHATSDFTFARIARTSFSGSTSGSKSIVGTFQITFEYKPPASAPFVGMPLDKMGAATGWTAGKVSDTCLDIASGGFVYFCQDLVNAGATFGDSGSPVFRRVSDSEVWFYGLLWGGIEGGKYVFSSLTNIAADGLSVTTY